MIAAFSIRVGRRIRIAAFAIAALVLMGLIALAATAVAALPERPCSTPPPLTANLPRLLEVGACLAAIGLGRVLASVRLLPRDRLAAAGTGAHRLRTAVVVQSGLVAFLLFAAALLWYETFALNNFGRFWPITYYVRCANHLADLPTLAGAVAISFLFGHWFWPPAARTRD